MKEVYIVNTHPRHDNPAIFVVFFSDGEVYHYDSINDCWLRRNPASSNRYMFVR